MAILVVGGAGYVGSHTARLLRQQGYEVIIYDNLSTGQKSLAAGCELVVGEIADRETLIHTMKHVDAVMHFAAKAYVGESVEHPRTYFHNNVESALTLLNTTLDSGICNFVFSSSCAVYGVPATVPIVEDMPRQPINPYGMSKLFFENAMESYEKAYGLRYASLRYFNAAGADESGEIGEIHDPETHIIPLALAAADGTGPELQLYGTDYPTPDGTCIRDYVHVNDLAEGHLLALKLLMNGRTSLTLNLGTGEGHSIKQLLNEIKEVTGKQVPYRAAMRRPGDPPILVADPSRAQNLLPWKARRSLRQIISTAWNWYRLHQNLHK
jgi:UDP-glucose-4-epimerase GalE